MKKDSINILLDLETLGVGDEAIVTQIGASVFDIKTGKLLDYQKDFGKVKEDGEIWFTEEEYNDLPYYFYPYNEKLDMNSMDKIEVDVGTLQFWNKDTHNSLLFKDLINQEGLSEQELWEDFHTWLVNIVEFSKDKDVKIWGNGISFDVQKIKYNLKKWNLSYPINFYNERDVRTLVDFASEKLGISDFDFKNSIKNDNPHDALADVQWEALYLSKAYCLFINEEDS